MPTYRKVAIVTGGASGMGRAMALGLSEAGFDVAAVDYLVKPFDDERFEQAMQRARHLHGLEALARLREQMLDLLNVDARGTTADLSASHATAPAHVTTDAPTATTPPLYLERIAVEMRGKVSVVPVGLIDYITASGPYAELHVGGRTMLIREAMQTLEERLDPAHFCRLHRSVIVRLELVETLLKGPGGDYEVQLKGGARLRVSRSRREALERWLGVTG